MNQNAESSARILFYRLKKLKISIESNITAWKAYYDASSPEDAKCPAPFDTVKDLTKLVVLRCIRPDKIVPAVQVLVTITYVLE
jgi:dynein heavy chain